MYDDIKAAVDKAQTDEEMMGALFSSVIGMTWGPDSPETQAKRDMVNKFCKMYLGIVD